jgi:hypothetical protein
VNYHQINRQYKVINEPCHLDISLRIPLSHVQVSSLKCRSSLCTKVCEFAPARLSVFLSQQIKKQYFCVSSYTNNRRLAGRLVESLNSVSNRPTVSRSSRQNARLAMSHALSARYTPLRARTDTRGPCHEKNSRAVPKLVSWCHLDLQTLNNIFLGP